MNNKSNKKLLTLSIIFVIFWATITLANPSSNNYLNVKPVLNRAVQTIQSIIFNEHAVGDISHPEKEVILESNHGTVMIRWRVFAETTWSYNELTADSDGSSLFYWRENKLAWKDSYIIWGVSNKIESDVSWSTIIGWTNNNIKKWYNNHILWGAQNIINEWESSFIVWWHDNTLTWNHSYIIWWSHSSVSGNNSIAAWSDIQIEKDNIFAWKDTSDDVKLRPRKENTFIWFAENWISIWYTQPTIKNIWKWTVDINWLVQFSQEPKRCGVNIAGAIQFTGWLEGCFCTCNWDAWVSLIPNRKCKGMCSTITWSVESDYQDWVCRYTKWQNASVWSLDKSQACDNWEAADFKEVEWGTAWSWKCVGNSSTEENCYAKKTVEEWKCSVYDAEDWIADYYDKCEQWYPFETKTTHNNVYTWTCKWINANDSVQCKGCLNNRHYYTGTVWKKNSDKCVNANWVCNDKYNWKDLFEIDTDKLCSNWTSWDFNIVNSKETGKQIGWEWSCIWEDSTAKCSANYKFELWRCESTYAEGIHAYWKCNRGVVSGETVMDENNIIHWQCVGINADSVDNCQWCGNWYIYNRKTHKCDKKGCDYNTWYRHYKVWQENELGEEETIGRFVVQTCNRRTELADKNIWATVAWEWETSYGKYFQRWNNHWFTKDELADNNNYTEQRAAWSDDYNKKWYYWPGNDKFVLQLEDESKCDKYNYWTGCTIHRNLWWWDRDWYVSWNYTYKLWVDWLYTVHSNDISDLIEDHHNHPKWSTATQDADVVNYVLNTWAISRRGPCPEWWHVPAAWEWGALLMDFCKLDKYKSYCIDSTDPNWKRSSISTDSNGAGAYSTSNDKLGKQFLKVFLLPKAWRVMPNKGLSFKNRIRWAGDSAYYRSSSFTSDEYVEYLRSNNSWIYATSHDWESRWWVPIRCFKNPEIIVDDEDGSRNVRFP